MGENNRLIFVNWGNNAAIKTVDLSDNSVSTILSTNLSNIDGIDEDNEGNYYIASWGPSQISKFDNAFADPLEVITTPFINNPADIGYSLEIDTMGIPIGNNVVFVGFESTMDTTTMDTTTTSIDFLDATAIDFKVYPNPVTDQSYIQFDLEVASDVHLEILSLEGKRIHTLLNTTQSSGTHKVLFAGHDLPTGIYYCRLEVNQKIATKKIMVH